VTTTATAHIYVNKEDKMEIGYKVVNLDYQSMISGNPGAVDYGDFWATPGLNGGPLAIFTNWLAAFHFVEINAFGRFARIMKCAYIPEEKLKYLWVVLPDGWKVCLHSMDFPPGTRLARAVHLLKEERG